VVTTDVVSAREARRCRSQRRINLFDLRQFSAALHSVVYPQRTCGRVNCRVESRLRWTETHSNVWERCRTITV